MSLLERPRWSARPAARQHPELRAEKQRALGLSHSTALVMGSIIGVGIFSLPYAIASYGPISLAAMGVATVGAVALAAMFATMSRRMPAGGGPYAYVRAAFGDGLGFSQAWLYWITAAELARAVAPLHRKHPEVPVRYKVTPGRPAEVIADLSDTVALVLLGRHGHRRTFGYLGRVPRAVIQTSRAPVEIGPAPGVNEPEFDLVLERKGTLLR